MKPDRYEWNENSFFIFDEELDLCIEGSLLEASIERSYFPNGKLKQETYYLQGQLHGPSSFHSETGILLSQAWFYQNKRVGKTKRYHSSGVLYSIERFKENRREGKQEYYYEQGSLKTVLFYRHGKLHGEMKLYWSNGALKRSCHFLEGQKIDFDRLHDEKGHVIEEQEYKDGKPFRNFTTAIS